MTVTAEFETPDGDTSRVRRSSGHFNTKERGGDFGDPPSAQPTPDVAPPLCITPRDEAHGLNEPLPPRNLEADKRQRQMREYRRYVSRVRGIMNGKRPKHERISAHRIQGWKFQGRQLGDKLGRDFDRDVLCGDSVFWSDSESGHPHTICDGIDRS